MAGRLSHPDRTQVGELMPDDAPALSTPMKVDTIGRVEQIGKYEVRGVLGRGGMGIVYDVVGQDGKAFALKTIETRFLELDDSNAGRRFSQEIRVLRRLDHRSIVRLFDYGFARHPMEYELAFFVMEKLVGETLEQRFKRGAPLFDAMEALRIVEGLTDALMYLEQHGVLHRDIKPGNLSIEPDGRAVLMDFGLARSAEFTRLTQMGHVIGTLGYMSPEALRGQEIDSTSDVFALGVVLFEMLTGEQPYHEKDATRRVQEIKGGLVWPEGIAIRQDVKELVEEMIAYDRSMRLTPVQVGERARAMLMASPPPEPTMYKPPAPRRPQEPTRSQQIQAGDVSDESALISAKYLQAAAPQVSSVPGVAPDAPFMTESSQPADPLPTTSAGPSWVTAGLSMGGLAAVTFGLGIFVGRATVEERVIVQPAPAPPPKIITTAPPFPPPQPVEKPEPEPEPEEKEVKLPKFETAKEAYRFGDQALKDRRPDEAVGAFREALRLNPAYADVHRRLGDALLALGDIEGAQASYKTYLALRPTAPDAEDVKRLLDEI